MADDVQAPHEQEFELPDETDIKQIIRSISSTSYLPTIQGGKATWVAVSNIPIAVLSQEKWGEPRMLHYLFEESFNKKNGVLRIHFNYQMQLDPDVVYKVLSRLTLGPS